MGGKCLCGDPADAHVGQTIDDEGMCHVIGCPCERYQEVPEKVTATFMVKVEYDPTNWAIPNFEQDTLMDLFAGPPPVTMASWVGSDVRDVQFSLAKVEVS